jgi:tellurite resistance protein TerC
LHGIPDIPISVSLGAIVLILGLTTIASLVKSSRDRKAAERTAGQAISDPTEDDHPDW